jgi:hypothetical protein
VEPAVPAFLGKLPTADRRANRLDLAKWLVEADNPLTARVMVNRLWQHHFGRGLVSTPSDFGKQGGTPSHPELLDWLAAEFISSGWSVKHMHRLMMLSQTYQQSSRTSDPRDPENRLLARMVPHRLSFEEARDAWLVVGGLLQRSVGGRPEALFANKPLRRTLYALVDRESLPPVLRTFDFANPDLSIPQRNETIVPQQALFGMNHPFVIQMVKAVLKRKEVQAQSSTALRLEILYDILFQRKPSDVERVAAVEFLKDESTGAQLTVWEQWVQVMLLSNEFMFVD